MTTACCNSLFAYKCTNVFLYLVPTIDVDPANASEMETNGANIAVSIVAALLVAVIIITVVVLVAWAGDRATGAQTKVERRAANTLTAAT